MSRRDDTVSKAKDRAFAAQHDGRCAACQTEFEAGEMITMIDGQTVHASTDLCIEQALDA